MFIKRNYGFWMTFHWSKKPFFIGLAYAAVICIAQHRLDFPLSLPWQPISIIGIAVAFYLGFKNNSSYDRTWEARKIWGGIVNSSRTFGAAVRAFIRGEGADSIHKELIYRHIAWLTALRYQLRLSREWEHTEERIKGLYMPTICEEYFQKLDQDLAHFIPEEEFQGYKPKTNIAAQILAKQAHRLQELYDAGYIDHFRHMELHRMIGLFYDDQGRSERIKNFPFPRQYASTTLWVSVIFAVLLPFGLLDAFAKAEGWRLFLMAPMNGLVTWIFFLMEKIGDYSENPFEGSYNDVPITALSRGIEIDLREMINDTHIPPPIPSQNGFLM